MADVFNVNRLARIAVIVGAAVAFTASSANARGWFDRTQEDLSGGYVVAESRYGNGTVSGPVRFRRLGPQVRTPGGNWHYCRRTCAETLRVETIDFWDAQDNYGGTAAAECGVFGCLDLRF